VKIILAQPSVTRFLWELEVLLTNLREFGDFEIVLLFTRHNDTIPQHLADKYGVSCFVYGDKRADLTYHPSVRPYLLWQYLKADPMRERETYLYIDSDVIFREWLDFDKIGAKKNMWVGSNCSGYIDHNYVITRQHGPKIAAKMAEICGITVDDMKGVPGIGAHIVMVDPTAAFWERAYRDSEAIWQYFQTVDSDIQKWTAEMWAQLWGMVREGKNPTTVEELDFCNATDNYQMWEKGVVKIMHNAGAIEGRSLFLKGNYADKTPWGEDFSWVRRDKCSYAYIQALEKVVL
jgi:hypothetical protein